MRRLVVFGIALVTLFSATTIASAHGYPTDFPSRQYLCSKESQGDCGAIDFQPQSVQGPIGFPAAGPPDGAICSGGISEFAVLDRPKAPNGADWLATGVEPGDPARIWWTITGRHPTKSFRYFVTRDDWDPSKPLTRAQLDPEPFATIPYGGQPANPLRVAHDVTLPEKTDGRHVILGVWDAADVPYAYYACMDVVFAGI